MGQGLPENAFRELKPGEKYVPVIKPDQVVPEVTPRSMAFGFAMGLLFSAAASYIALKLGQGIESAIPISILAIGFSALMRRKSTLLENINILAIGATSGILVGGSTFTMPAIYILGLEGKSSFFQIFLVPFLGAVLGVLFLIPFRRYFVAEMHGKLPFPEGTAIAEVLMTGERGGKQAKVLVSAMGLGFVFDFVVLAFKTWSEVFSTAAVGALRYFTNKLKMVFAINTSAAVLGLGYIIGVRYAAIICSGSFLAYFVLVPLVGWVGRSDPAIASLGAEEIFSEYVKYIGIGGIFTAGIISILKMSPVMKRALAQAFGEIARMLRHGSERAVSEDRTDSDIPMGLVAVMTLATAVAIWVYFRFSVLVSFPEPTKLATVALVLTLAVAFLFAAVSAWAVAMISVTPISGMTLTTLIISAALLSALGLGGREGMLPILLIGGVVCTALSMTGSLVTQFKVAYWIGATPKKIEWWNIIGSAVASAAVTFMIMLFAHTQGYVKTPEHPHPMAAPQANAMAALLSSMMAAHKEKVILYFLGAAVALVVELLGISSLAFALGMYLPIELNTPVLFGALVAEFVRRRSPDEHMKRARNNRGTLIASGLIAGGALAGVADGFMKMALGEAKASSLRLWSLSTTASNWLSLIMLFVLSAYVVWDASRAAPEEGEGPEVSM